MKQLYYFSANWCPSCKGFSQTINQISQITPIINIDCDYEPDVVSKFNVKSIPTVIIAEGGKELRRFTGVKSYQELKNFINE